VCACDNVKIRGARVSKVRLLIFTTGSSDIWVMSLFADPTLRGSLGAAAESNIAESASKVD
jgi:hypothetical protein